MTALKPRLRQLLKDLQEDWPEMARGIVGKHLESLAYCSTSLEQLLAKTRPLISVLFTRKKHEEFLKSLFQGEANIGAWGESPVRTDLPLDRGNVTIERLPALMDGETPSPKTIERAIFRLAETNDCFLVLTTFLQTIPSQMEGLVRVNSLACKPICFVVTGGEKVGDIDAASATVLKGLARDFRLDLVQTAFLRPGMGFVLQECFCPDLMSLVEALVARERHRWQSFAELSWLALMHDLLQQSLTGILMAANSRIGSLSSAHEQMILGHENSLGSIRGGAEALGRDLRMFLAARLVGVVQDGLSAKALEDMESAGEDHGQGVTYPRFLADRIEKAMQSGLRDELQAEMNRLIGRWEIIDRTICDDERFLKRELMAAGDQSAGSGTRVEPSNALIKELLDAWLAAYDTKWPAALKNMEKRLGGLVRIKMSQYSSKRSRYVHVKGEDIVTKKLIRDAGLEGIRAFRESLIAWAQSLEKGYGSRAINRWITTIGRFYSEAVTMLNETRARWVALRSRAEKISALVKILRQKADLPDA